MTTTAAHNIYVIIVRPSSSASSILRSGDSNESLNATTPTPNESAVASRPLTPPDTVSLLGDMNREVNSKFAEQQRLHNDLRRDVSDMGMLMEV